MDGQKGDRDKLKSKHWPIANPFLPYFFWVFDWLKEFKKGRNYVYEHWNDGDKDLHHMDMNA